MPPPAYLKTNNNNEEWPSRRTEGERERGRKGGSGRKGVERSDWGVEDCGQKGDSIRNNVMNQKRSVSFH